jgi:hypothetical protein
MDFLADLFNPTFIMFLGILVLVVAILIIYFEGKMREQNHKITTMFSLVSTLAEDMNGIKLGFNQLAINSVGGGGQFFRQTLEEPVKTFNIEENVNLINVSDDEESDNDEDSNSEAESEINDDSDSEEDLDLDEENNEHEIDVHDNESEDNDSHDEDFDNKSDIKVLKIYNNTNEENEIEEINNNSQELDVLDEIGEMDDLDNLDEKSEEKYIDINSGFNLDFKKININLEEIPVESLDYKKLSLQKLRSIVSEKGLANDTSKIKKPELLKLLGVE